MRTLDYMGRLLALAATVLWPSVVYAQDAAAPKQPRVWFEMRLEQALEIAGQKGQRVLVLLTGESSPPNPVSLVNGVLSDSEVVAAIRPSYQLTVCKRTRQASVDRAWKALYERITGKADPGQQLYPLLAVLGSDGKTIATTVPDNDGRSTVEKVKKHVLSFLKEHAP